MILEEGTKNFALDFIKKKFHLNFFLSFSPTLYWHMLQEPSVASLLILCSIKSSTLTFILSQHPFLFLLLSPWTLSLTHFWVFVTFSQRLKMLEIIFINPAVKVPFTLLPLPFFSHPKAKEASSRVINFIINFFFVLFSRVSKFYWS